MEKYSIEIFYGSLATFLVTIGIVFNNTPFSETIGLFWFISTVVLFFYSLLLILVGLNDWIKMYEYKKTSYRGWFYCNVFVRPSNKIAVGLFTMFRIFTWSSLINILTLSMHWGVFPIVGTLLLVAASIFLVKELMEEHNV